MPFIEPPKQEDLRDGPLFLRAMGATAVGIGAALLLFPAHAGLVGVVLAGFAKAPAVNALLDRNRDEIWGNLYAGDAQRMPPWKANLRLARSLLAIFLGVFLTYVIAVQIAPDEHLEGWFGQQLGNFVGGSLLDIDFGRFGELMARNGLVLVGSFLFALVYQHAGLLLVLAWNASRWGVVFSYVAVVAGEDADVSTVGYLLQTMAAILPHLLLEAVAYVLAAMAGVFLSRGARRHDLGSDAFFQVGMAVLRIGLTGVAVLCAAAAFEARITPEIVQALFER